MHSPIRLSSLCALGLILGATTARVAAEPPNIRTLFLAQLADVEKKVTGLAQATPAGKYSWRPAPGVRSVSEVFVHIAGANYMFPTFAGVKTPAGIGRDMEKTVTEKAKVLEVVKQSFEHARQAVQGLSDADLAKDIKLFGQPNTVGGMLFIMANHMHEHLGQSIAYARTNGVVPPWSAGKE